MKRLMMIPMLAALLAPAFAAPDTPATPPAADADLQQQLKEMQQEMRGMREELKRMQEARAAAPAGTTAPTPPTAPAPPAAPTAPTPPVPPVPPVPPRHVKEVVIVNHDYTVAQGEVVDGNARVVNGDLLVDGIVNGDASTVNGDLSVNGQVKGDAVAVRGDLQLGPKAAIGGDVRSVNGEIQREDGSQVGGKISSTEGPVSTPSIPDGHGKGWVKEALFDGPMNLPTMLVIFLLGVFVLAAAPQRVDLIGKTFVNRPVYSFVVGAGSVPAMIAATVVSIVTIVGPVFVVGAWIGALFMGAVALALMLGRRVVAGKPYRSRLYPFVVGLAVWFLASFISHVSSPLSALMNVATMLAYAMALGAAIATGFGASPDWLKDRLYRRAPAFSYMDPSNTYAGKGDH